MKGVGNPIPLNEATKIEYLHRLFFKLLCYKYTPLHSWAFASYSILMILGNGIQLLIGIQDWEENVYEYVVSLYPKNY